jgi:hypothetical protein
MFLRKPPGGWVMILRNDSDRRGVRQRYAAAPVVVLLLRTFR